MKRSQGGKAAFAIWPMTLSTVAPLLTAAQPRPDHDRTKSSHACRSVCNDTPGRAHTYASDLKVVLPGLVDRQAEGESGPACRYVDKKTVHKHEKESAQAGKASFSWAWLLDERPEERARGERAS